MNYLIFLLALTWEGKGGIRCSTSMWCDKSQATLVHPRTPSVRYPQMPTELSTPALISLAITSSSSTVSGAIVGTAELLKYCTLHRKAIASESAESDLSLMSASSHPCTLRLLAPPDSRVVPRPSCSWIETEASIRFRRPLLLTRLLHTFG